MPRYEFMCPKCHKQIEIEKSIHDDTSPLCCEESCGDIKMEQVISSTSFSLRGGGWAKDGYSKQ